MKTITKIALAATFAGFIAGQSLPVQAQAMCGWYAFGAATKSKGKANRLAARYGARVLDVDASNSPNAGQGWWTVAIGPGSKGSANSWRRSMRSRGASGAYVGHRCFYDTPRTGY